MNANTRYKDNPVMRRRFFDLAALADEVLNNTDEFFKSPSLRARKSVEHLFLQTFNDVKQVEDIQQSLLARKHDSEDGKTILEFNPVETSWDNTSTSLYAILDKEKTPYYFVVDKNNNPLLTARRPLSQVLKVTEEEGSIIIRWAHWDMDGAPSDEQVRKEIIKIVEEKKIPLSSHVETVKFRTIGG